MPELGRCAKQQTVAIIENNGKFWIGRNDCASPQQICPRVEQNCKTGEGYNLCIEVCEQQGHAEVMACKEAGEEARGGTLYLFGHYYCCDNCLKVMKEHGIKDIKIMSYEPLKCLQCGKEFRAPQGSIFCKKCMMIKDYEHMGQVIKGEIKDLVEEDIDNSVDNVISNFLEAKIRKEGLK